MQSLVALTIFLWVVLGWRWYYIRQGNFNFWQLVAYNPDTAYQWMRDRPDWIVLYPKDPIVKQLKKAPDFTGPFKMHVPSLNSHVIIFAEGESLNASKRNFIELYCGRREKEHFPWFSWLAMLYPIMAILWCSLNGIPLLITLGYGFANLGYLLLISGVLAGSFRALGFRYRKPTIIAAIIFWLYGTILSNLWIIF